MFEIICNGLKGLVVSKIHGFYQVNFGNENYDLFKWVSFDEIRFLKNDNYVLIF